MVHRLFDTADVVLRIARLVLALERQADMRRHRPEYLAVLARLCRVCRPLHATLQPIIHSHLLLSVRVEPRRSALRTLAASWISARPASPRAPVAQAVRRSVSRVRTIMVDLLSHAEPGQLREHFADSGFCAQPWPRATCVFVRVSPDAIKSPGCVVAQALALVFEHARFVSSVYVMRSGPTNYAEPELDVRRVLGAQAKWVRSLCVGDGFRCQISECPVPLAELALTLCAQTSDAQLELLRRVCASVRRLELREITPRDLDCVVAAVEFGCLQRLRICLCTHAILSGASAAGLLDAGPGRDPRFPRLRQMRLEGYYQTAPPILLRALAAAAPLLDHLHMDLTIRNSAELEVWRIPRLRRLDMRTTVGVDVQPALDALFACGQTLDIVAVASHGRVEGCVPESLHLERVRELWLADVCVPLPHVWRLVRLLPLLVQLEATVLYEAGQDMLLETDDGLATIAEHIEPVLASRLELLALSHRRDVLVAQRISRLGVQLMALLCSLPALRRFRGRDCKSTVEAFVARMLDDHRVARVADHLRRLDVC